MADWAVHHKLELKSNQNKLLESDWCRLEGSDSGVQELKSKCNLNLIEIRKKNPYFEFHTCVEGKSQLFSQFYTSVESGIR